MTPSSDETLADIDATLQAYVPPAHLPLVLTPEEAEELGHEPPAAGYLSVADMVPSRSRMARIQAALYMSSYAELRERHREQMVFAILREQLGRRHGEPVDVRVWRESYRMQTYAEARGEHVVSRWLLTSEYDFPQQSTIIRASFYQFRRLGDERWTEVRRDQHVLQYVVPEPVDPARYYEMPPMASTTMRARTIDLSPFSMSVPDEVVSRARWEGYRADYAFVDEVAEAMRGVGVAARRAAQMINDLHEAATPQPEEVREDLEPVPDQPAVIASRRERRHHLTAQQSPYGPPARGRRH